jgi:hypothetical protein
MKANAQTTWRNVMLTADKIEELAREFDTRKTRHAVGNDRTAQAADLHLAVAPHVGLTDMQNWAMSLWASAEL